jgi:hypothetical protein
MKSSNFTCWRKFCPAGLVVSSVKVEVHALVAAGLLRMAGLETVTYVSGMDRSGVVPGAESPISCNKLIFHR